MKTNKGITLIALVITIIVMLILVVVTIRIATNGGLFDYAGRAARETKDAIADETDIANGKITIGGVTYNSIDEFVNRNNVSRLKYKVEGSNIIVYLVDSYYDYLETNELEDSKENYSDYTSYITNKIAEKPTEEKENYIVKVWNKKKGTSYKNIGELIATEYGSQEAFIEAMFSAPQKETLTKMGTAQIMKESTVEQVAYLTIATEKAIIKEDDSNNSDSKTYEDAINEQYSNLYWSKLSLELPNKETILIGDIRQIYGVTESGKYKFTLTNEMGEISTINVPVTIQKTNTTKFATITECGYSITIPFTEGQTWKELLGDSRVTICGMKLYIFAGRVEINGGIMKQKSPKNGTDVNVTPSDEIEEKQYKKGEAGKS